MARFLFFDDKVINILVKDEKPSGGSAVQSLGWIKGLSETGQDVYVLTNPAPRETLKEECRNIQLLPLFDERKGIRWIRWVYYRLPYLYKKIKQTKPDYLYQSIPGWTSFLIGMICYSLNIKYILRISNDFLVDERIYRNYSRAHRFFQRLGFRLTHSILCQNDYQLSRIKQEFPDKRAYKISNPIFSMVSAEAGAPAAKKYIAWLGLFQYQKNLKLLYQIASLLPQEQFKVAGKALPSIDAESQLYLEKLKELPNVEFAGFLHRKEVLPFLAQAKFLLNTSHYEGFSNTFLEAMSVATPIITSHNVNPDGLITNNHLGLVYQDAADLQRQYQALNPEVYETLSQNALKYVLEHHDYKMLATNLINLLNSN